jgi:hypothetical protein
MHTCPMATPGTPPDLHIGGPILRPVYPMVLVGGMPAGRLRDMATFAGPPDSIDESYATVMIGGSLEHLCFNPEGKIVYLLYYNFRLLRGYVPPAMPRR